MFYLVRYQWEIPITFTTDREKNFNKTGSDIQWLHKNQTCELSSLYCKTDLMLALSHCKQEPSQSAFDLSKTRGKFLKFGHNVNMDFENETQTF